MKNAMFVVGGWEGHTPQESAGLFATWLQQQGFAVELADSLAVYADTEKLQTLDLIVPCWTMGELTEAQEKGLCDAVAAGVGLAGWHGTMCDSFRNSVNYQWMTGGQWVAHPGDIKPAYDVRLVDDSHAITRGLQGFTLRETEQYYMHVDPAVQVLATTTFDNGADMPAVWVKSWGQGRVAYASFGHTYRDFDVPEALEIVQRGMLWAAR